MGRGARQHGPSLVQALVRAQAAVGAGLYTRCAQAREKRQHIARATCRHCDGRARDGRGVRWLLLVRVRVLVLVRTMAARRSASMVLRLIAWGAARGIHSFPSNITREYPHSLLILHGNALPPF